MNLRSLLLMMTVLTPVATLAQSANANNSASGNNGATASTTASASPASTLDSYTELVQQYIARRAVLLEQRKATQAKIKSAATVAEKKKARDDQDVAEKDFHVQNAELIKQLRAAEAKKPGAAQPNGGK